MKLMEQFESFCDRHPGQTTVVKFRIVSSPPDASSIHSVPRFAGSEKWELECDEVGKMREVGVAESAIAEWALPIEFAPKKDGSIRFSVSNRRLNAATDRNSYRIPRINERIDSLGDVQTILTLEVNSGYWQIKMEKMVIDGTAFVTHHGLLKYTRKPFGLKSQPAMFQRAIDVVLASVKWRHALVCIDEVIIFTKTSEEHLKHIDEVLRSLKKGGVTPKLKKCHFYSKIIYYVGHVIAPGKVRVARKQQKPSKQYST